MKKSLKLPAYLLSASLTIPSFAGWQPEPYSYKVQSPSSNVVYTATLNRDSIDRYRKTWDIRSGTYIIGDELHEKEQFNQLAYTAAIVKHIESPTLEGAIILEKRNIEGSIRLHNLTNVIAKNTLDYSSQLGGMLLPSIATGSLDSSAKAQYSLIQTAAKKSALNFIESLVENVYIQDPNLTEVKIANELKRSANETALKHMDSASRNLDKAMQILHNHKGFWSFNDANDFYIAWKTGVIDSKSYSNLLQDINHIDWRNIGREFGINFLKGAGIPLSVLLKSPEVKNFLAKNIDIETKLAKYTSDANTIFEPIEDLFQDIEMPISQANQNMQISEYSNPDSKVSDFETVGRKVEQFSRGENRCIDWIFRSKSNSPYYSYSMSIDDVISPEGIRSSQQNIGVSVESVKTGNMLLEPLKSYTMSPAFCISALPQSAQGSYTIKFRLNYKDSAGYVKQSSQLEKTIVVK